MGGTPRGPGAPSLVLVCRRRSGNRRRRSRDDLAFSALQHWYPRLAPGLEGGFLQVTAIRFVIAFLVLILPTALMGATLPLVVRSSAFQAGHVGAIGVLYGSNTNGAIVGTIVAGLWLIPVLGMRATFVAAASLNLLAAASAILVSRTQPIADSGAVRAEAGGDAPVPPMPRVAADSDVARAMVLITFTVSGGVALALEVVWLRSATIILGPTVYTVSVLLAAILAGIALGIA